jgi:hypothetical protein
MESIKDLNLITIQLNVYTRASIQLRLVPIHPFSSSILPPQRFFEHLFVFLHDNSFLVSLYFRLFQLEFSSGIIFWGETREKKFLMLFASGRRYHSERNYCNEGWAGAGGVGRYDHNAIQRYRAMFQSRFSPEKCLSTIKRVRPFSIAAFPCENVQSQTRASRLFR